MLHLFDANVLITANNTYLAIDQVGEYWEWVQYQGEIGNIKIPAEIMEEILAGKDTKKGQKNEDLLLPWIKQPHVKKALLLDEKVNPALVAEVITKGYAPDLKDTELEVIGRDPFIVAYANDLHSVITFADEARPALFWKVYLAFDEGEYRHENDEPEADPVQTYTHPMVAEIVSEYADIQIK